jgi:hypothetical protein
VNRDLDLERPAPLEPNPRLRSESELEPEAGLDVHPAEKRRDEAVALGRVDDELAAGDRAVRLRPAGCLAGSAIPRELGAAAETDAGELEPGAARLSGQDERRRRLRGERRVRARGQGLRGLDLDLERRPHRPLHPCFDRRVRDDRGDPRRRRDRERERLVDGRRKHELDLEAGRRAGARRLEVNGERLERDRIAARWRAQQHREAELADRGVEDRQELRGVEARVAPVIRRLELRDRMRHRRNEPVEVDDDAVVVGLRRVRRIAGVEDALDDAERLEEGADRRHHGERVVEEQVEEPRGQVGDELVDLRDRDPRQARRGRLQCSRQLLERGDQLRDRR